MSEDNILDKPTKETREFTCRVCKKQTIGTLAGKFDAYNKRWVDEHGSAHNGLECSICFKARIKTNMASLRKKNNGRIPI